jgi:hypothetical protein
LTLGLLLTASAAWGQEKVHRLEIYNGPMRTVHYYVEGLSMGERASLSDLQRLENEVAFTDQLAALRQQYIRDERELQRRRAVVQNLLYGTSTTYATGFYPGAVWVGGYPYGYGLPLSYAYPNVVTTAALYPIGSVGTTTQSLLFGIGDEGVIKTEMARVLASQASPQYAALARQEYLTALDRASNDPKLGRVLGLKKGDVALAEFARVVPPGMGLSAGDQVSLTARDGKTIDGKFVRETGDWVTVDTGKEQVTVRKSEITRFAKKQQPDG